MFTRELLSTARQMSLNWGEYGLRKTGLKKGSLSESLHLVNDLLDTIAKYICREGYERVYVLTRAKLHKRFTVQ